MTKIDELIQTLKLATEIKQECEQNNKILQATLSLHKTERHCRHCGSNNIGSDGDLSDYHCRDCGYGWDDYSGDNIE